MMRRSSTLEPAAPPIDAEPVRLKARRRSPMGSVIGHTGFNVARYHITHVFGGLFPLLAGVLVFGWRAVLSVAIVLVVTLAAGLVWRRIGTWGHPLRPTQLLWFALVLALMLPAELLRSTPHDSPWALLPCAALMMVMLSWAGGGIGSGRFHPAVVVYLLLALLYAPEMKSDLVLQRHRLLAGDLLSAPDAEEPKAPQFAWRYRTILPDQDSLRVEPAAQSLQEFTRSERSPGGARLSLETVLRDHVPPLEDLVLGAAPGGIGVTSAVAVIIGGLFLLYRGLIDFRIPLLITAAAWVALLVLPIPAGIHDRHDWRWLPGHAQGVGWAMGVTLANYEMLASPLLFTAFFLAGSPNIRPLSRKGRVIYASLIGVLAAAFQLYLSVSLGSYLALLLVGLMTPFLDRCMGSRALV
jgi:electron transport complex protein RnfD